MGNSGQKQNIILLSSDRDLVTKLKNNFATKYNIVAEVNCDEALHFIRNEFHPAVVLIDIEIPGDHNDFISKLYKSYPAASRVLITPKPELKEAVTLVNSSSVLMFIKKNAGTNEYEQTLKIAVDHSKTKSSSLYYNKEIKALNSKIDKLSNVNQSIFPQLMYAIQQIEGGIDAYYCVPYTRTLMLTVKSLCENLELDTKSIMRISTTAVLFSMIMNVLPNKFLNINPLKVDDESERSVFIDHYFKNVNRFLKLSEFKAHATILHQIWERNDGSGFPNGTQGSKLSKEPQIIALAFEFIHLTFALKSDKNALPIRENIDIWSLRKKYDDSMKILNHKPQRFSYDLYTSFIGMVKRRTSFTLNPELMIDVLNIQRVRIDEQNENIPE